MCACISVFLLTGGDDSKLNSSVLMVADNLVTDEGVS